MTKKFQISNFKFQIYFGFSLIEILVVISLFAVVGVMTSQILLTSLRNSRKAESSVRVRTNLEQALSVIERQIRGATEITACTDIKLDYTDAAGNAANFRCVPIGGAGDPVGFIASGSAQLTNSLVDVDCAGVFTCSPPPPGDINTVDIVLNGKDLSTSGAESKTVTVRTKIFLRN